MGGRGEDRSNSFEAQHAAIIARTLLWADEAARRHDYAEALRWLDTIEGVGETLPSEYEAKRRTWLEARGRLEGRSRPGGVTNPAAATPADANTQRSRGVSGCR